jgi:hypothetical protein
MLQSDCQASENLCVEVHVGHIDPVDYFGVLEIAEEKAQAGWVHVAVSQFDPADGIFTLEDEVPKVGHEVDVESLVVKDIDSLQCFMV